MKDINTINEFIHDRVYYKEMIFVSEKNRVALIPFDYADK